MTNDKDIVRYEMPQRYNVDGHGELPLSYGRYVRWEDYEDAVKELRGEVERLEEELVDKDCNYTLGYQDGHEDGFREGYSICEMEHGD